MWIVESAGGAFPAKPEDLDAPAIAQKIVKAACEDEPVSNHVQYLLEEAIVAALLAAVATLQEAPGVPRATNANARYWRARWEEQRERADTNEQFRQLYEAERHTTETLRRERDTLKADLDEISPAFLDQTNDLARATERAERAERRVKELEERLNIATR